MFPTITDDTLLQELPVVSLDLETTGLNVREERIVQVAVVLVIAGENNTTTIFESLVAPGITIPASSTRIHGISDLDVADAPRFIEINDDLHDALSNHVIVGHHIGFDLAVLHHESARADLRWEEPPALDLALLAAALEPGGTGRRRAPTGARDRGAPGRRRHRRGSAWRGIAR